MNRKTNTLEISNFGFCGVFLAMVIGKYPKVKKRRAGRIWAFDEMEVKTNGRNRNHD
ncbi:hypothetical protein [Aneurinibacillus thermoaerophilus]|uniref:hypothetical protein n=1 Tax=Aneurinibacillus thermoaerophilus TaxID=143495 RepID=UPI001586F948|nr:hypothetical protein [Aneurinibacillus thermoaerophilus]